MPEAKSIGWAKPNRRPAPVEDQEARPARRASNVRQSPPQRIGPPAGLAPAYDQQRSRLTDPLPRQQ